MTREISNKSENKHLRLTITNVLYVAFGICVNLFGLWISSQFGLPIRFNCLGTMLAACTTGPLGGALVAVVTTLLAMLTHKIFVIYLFQTTTIGILCGIFFKRKNHEMVELVNSAFVFCMAATILDVPLNLLFRQGYSGNRWGDALFDMMTQKHTPVLLNCTLDELLVNFPDMILSVFITAGYLFLLRFFSDKDSETTTADRQS